jgi:DNA-binding MarR family transcriptional regulator
MMKEMFHRQTNELYKGKITLPQFLAMSFLNKKGSSNMTELAHYMDITTAGMTGIISRLVAGRYARRVSDPKDRRVIIVKLTPRGVALTRKVNDERRQIIIDAFGKISEKEREDYLNIISHVLESFVEQRSYK